MINYKEKLKHINTFMLDYDGVMTNGIMILMPDDEPLRTANVKDGYALQLAVKKGYHVVIVSGGKSTSVIKRFESLKVDHVFLGVENKLEIFESFLSEHKLKPENVLYVGDDIPDYEVMQKAGLSFCPADAAEEIKGIAHYISHIKGGEGCVREAIEQVLKVQGKWMNKDAYEW
jgi:3-deoxy-D-manno-octulosonate 8-phosphate phosphatase (KDO 8-P phosphatase)